jgi:hypothetical protein
MNCLVCMLDRESSRHTLRMLPCGHVACIGCIITQLQEKNSACSICINIQLSCNPNDLPYPSFEPFNYYPEVFQVNQNLIGFNYQKEFMLYTPSIPIHYQEETASLPIENNNANRSEQSEQKSCFSSILMTYLFSILFYIQYFGSVYII